MHIECTDGTAYWDWSDHVLDGKRTDELQPGDTIHVVGPLVKGMIIKTVLRVIGDTAFRDEGGTWTPIDPKENGHPRSGVLYSCP